MRLGRPRGVDNLTRQDRLHRVRDSRLRRQDPDITMGVHHHRASLLRTSSIPRRLSQDRP